MPFPAFYSVSYEAAGVHNLLTWTTAPNMVTSVDNFIIAGWGSAGFQLPSFVGPFTLAYNPGSIAPASYIFTIQLGEISPTGVLIAFYAYPAAPGAIAMWNNIIGRGNRPIGIEMIYNGPAVNSTFQVWAPPIPPDPPILNVKGNRRRRLLNTARRFFSSLKIDHLSQTLDEQCSRGDEFWDAKTIV